MLKNAIFAGTILFLGLSAPMSAAESLPSDAVAVSFKEPVGDRFVAVIHQVMGTATIQKVSPTRYKLRIGPRGNQNDYAVFFAHLPSVKAVEPLPRLSAAEREMPPVVLGLPLQQAAAPQGAAAPAARPQAPRGYVPGQLLVKFKPGTSQQAIDELNASIGVSLKERLASIGVLLFNLPEGLAVEEAQRRFMESGLVQYAEPNRIMTIPREPEAPSDQSDGARLYISPNQLIGTDLLVRYRPGGPAPELIDQVYGTRPVERTDADEVRLALPPSMTPLVAARIFRLCPWVSQAEPAYGR